MTEVEPIPAPDSQPGSGTLPPRQGVFSIVDALLRDPQRIMRGLSGPGSRNVVLSLFGVGLLCNLLYGVVAGTFSGGMQLWAAPVKIAGGLLFAGCICLPSLYIFACLGRVRAGMLEVAGMIAGLLAIMSILLIGFAPVVWVFSQSTESLAAMGALHIVLGFVGLFFGMRFLGAAFVHFNGESRIGLAFWMMVFLLVSLQMTTALRPILDTAPTFLPREKKFFLVHWFDCVVEAAKPMNSRVTEAGR